VAVRRTVVGHRTAGPTAATTDEQRRSTLDAHERRPAATATGITGEELGSGGAADGATVEAALATRRGGPGASVTPNGESEHLSCGHGEGRLGLPTEAAGDRSGGELAPVGATARTHGGDLERRDTAWHRYICGVT
jgi:hypothetical protein